MKLVAEPAVALVDEPTRLAVEGARPGSTVRLRARTHDDGGRPWSSEAVFPVADDGTVDPGRDAPVSGSYSGVDAQGLLWSMGMEGHAVHDAFSKYAATPLTMTFSVEAEDGTTAEAVVERQLAGPGVRQVAVDAPGVVATAFRPEGDGPFPPVLVLSGTGGAILEGIAAVLASRGFATIAMAYFGREGLPPQSVEIPIEYFRKGLDWMLAQDWVAPGRIGVYATAKGAEAGILLGAHYDDVCTVVGYNASGLAYEALSLTSADGSPWTVGGEPVPFLSVATDFAGVRTATLDDPFCSTPAFLEALRDAEGVSRAMLPVEAVGGPLLLVTGTDDQVWPAWHHAELVLERMAAHGLADRVTHLAFEDAGHVLGVPYLPTTGMVTTRGGAIRALGGRAACNARAEAEAWAAVLAHFAQALRP